MKQRSRLLLAQEALWQAETKLEVESTVKRSVDRVPSSWGVFHLSLEREEVLPFRQLIAAVVEIGGPRGWVAFVGIPNVGWEAASHLGVNLQNVVNILHPGSQTPRVLGRLVESFQVVAVGQVSLRPSEQRRLAAKARTARSSILTYAPWPNVSVPLTTGNYTKVAGRGHKVIEWRVAN